MSRRTTLAFMTTALLGLAVANALPQIAFAQSNMVGTWKLNLAKSTYRGARRPSQIQNQPRQSPFGCNGRGIYRGSADVRG
jgi:hypothetical protein